MQDRLFKVRRKWVQVAKKSTGIRGVSQFSAPDVSCTHSLQNKLNRLYLKDEFAGELISRWGVKEGKSHSPRSDSALICEGQGAVLKSHCCSPLYVKWKTYRNPSAFQGHLNQISSRIRQYLSRTLQQSLVVRDALNFSCYSTRLRAGKLLFGRSHKCYDLAWNKRGDLEHVLGYPCVLFLWDLWKVTLCPSVCKGDWNGGTSNSWV